MHVTCTKYTYTYTYVYIEVYIQTHIYMYNFIFVHLIFSVETSPSQPYTVTLPWKISIAKSCLLSRNHNTFIVYLGGLCVFEGIGDLKTRLAAAELGGSVSWATTALRCLPCGHRSHPLWDLGAQDPCSWEKGPGETQAAIMAAVNICAQSLGSVSWRWLSVNVGMPCSSPCASATRGCHGQDPRDDQPGPEIVNRAGAAPVQPTCLNHISW